MDKWLEQLNEQQKIAVMHPTGPLFVVAGAGTGKTFTLTARIAYLIEYMNVNPANILAVTFTNKAAKEMKERIAKMAGPYASGLWVYTFHSFGVQVLRRDIQRLELGYTNSFNIADEDDAKVHVRAAIKSLNLDSKVYKANEIRIKISKYKHFGIDEFNDQNESNVYLRYQKELINSNQLDFDDLQVYTHRLLDQFDDIRSFYSKLFEHILVDEFQDTDDLQYQILLLLTEGKKEKNLFVVGDPDQSIYSFRGANYHNAIRFKQDFGGEHILDLNYRSSNQILSFANRLIKNNQNRPFLKELSSAINSDCEPIIETANTDYQEAYMVADEIKRLIYTKGYKYSDIAVLYRNNALSRIFEDVMIRNSIPYQIYGGMSFYERKEIKDILAYIRLMLDPTLNFYYKRVVNVPRRAIGDTTITKLENHASLTFSSLYRAVDTVDLPHKAKVALEGFNALIDQLKDYFDETTEIGNLVMEVATKTGYIQMLKDENDEVSLDRIDNIKELGTVFKQGDQYYEGTVTEKLQQLLDQISLYTELDKEVTKDAIILSTYHQVKGLEFKVVFMVAMEEDIFPSSRSFLNPYDLEEERRIAYVGITRAKERLYMTRAGQRMLYGNRMFSHPSRFLVEARGPLAQVQSNSLNIETTVSSILNKGDKVNHQLFGLGIVVSVVDEIATIAFSHPHGIKKILESHPSLKKI